MAKDFAKSIERLQEAYAAKLKKFVAVAPNFSFTLPTSPFGPYLSYGTNGEEVPPVPCSKARQGCPARRALKRYVE